MFETLTLSSVF